MSVFTNNKRLAAAALILAGLLAALSAGYWLGLRDRDRLVYVTTQKLYDEFAYTRSLEEELAGLQKRRTAALDSLAGVIQRQSAELDRRPTEAGKARYQQERARHARLQQKFEEEAREISGRYQTKIFDRINEYVRAFGQEQGYAFIYGATGSGAIMYAEEGRDVTEDALAYINQRYETSLGR